MTDNPATEPTPSALDALAQARAERAQRIVGDTARTERVRSGPGIAHLERSA